MSFESLVIMSMENTLLTSSMIAVFRTSMQTQSDVCKLAQWLAPLHGLTRWNVDLEDCDRVLRLEGNRIDMDAIQVLVQQAGYCCEELDD